MTERPDIDRTIDIYCGCWRDMDPGERLARLASVVSTDIIYIDPTISVQGVEAFADHIEKTILALPGAHIRRTTIVDSHHDHSRFGWRLLFDEGRRSTDGIDIVRFGVDGKLQSILGFFGSLAVL